MEQDNVFKALADENRRILLDRLFQQDGQTLSELCADLPMTRFGVMKHLQILEEANLITTRKVGREKLHYLNTVPIQLVYDRWVSKYAQPWVQTLAGLKYALEDNSVSDKHSHVFEVYIRTTPERIWQALTDGTITPQYYLGSRVESSWQPGAMYNYYWPDGTNLLEGEIIESDPPKKLITTFVPLFGPPSPDGTKPPASKVTWEIVPVGTACKLTLTHDDLEPDAPGTAGIISGWAQILSGLKTLLETGEPLVISQS